jgi:hypothetical protein
MHTYEVKAQASGQFAGAGSGLGWGLPGFVEDAVSAVANAAITTTAAAMTGGASLAYQAATGTVTKPVQAFKSAFTNICKLTSDPTMQTASTAAGAVPNPYAQGASTGVKSVSTVCALVNGQPAPAAPPAPIKLSVFKMPPKYPMGSIAYRDSTGVYRVAKPIATLAGLAPTFVEVGTETAPPAGVLIVSKSDYQKAVLPWYRRTNVLIGLLAGGAAASGGIYLYRKRR